MSCCRRQMVGGRNGKERSNPPAPESPLWLPSLSQTRSGQLSPGSTMPRARDVPGDGTLKSNPAELYRVENLAAQPLPLPAIGLQRNKVRDCISGLCLYLQPQQRAVVACTALSRTDPCIDPCMFGLCRALIYQSCRTLTAAYAGQVARQERGHPNSMESSTQQASALGQLRQQQKPQQLYAALSTGLMAAMVR